MSKHPVDNILWVDVNELKANDYNPNKVLSKELQLLKYSLLAQGWVQPVLVNKDENGGLVIIDGFHRTSLAKGDKDVYAMTDGKVPVVVLELTQPERMLLTIRINRAKGSHIAFKMHDIVKSLVNDHGYSVTRICEGIGAEKHEVETLIQESVFIEKDVANVEYSKSWSPVLAKNDKERKNGKDS